MLLSLMKNGIPTLKNSKTNQKIYLCTIFGLYNRYSVGYALSKRNDTALVENALKRLGNKNQTVTVNV